MTTNNNFGCVLQLLGMLQPTSISPNYQTISEIIKREIKPELYDRLVYVHQEAVNHQGYIELTNVDVDLFDTLVNFHPKNPQPVPLTVKKFLQRPGKVLAIEPTIDTEESGTYQLITNNNGHDIAIKKLGELQIYLMKETDTSPTMISSFERFRLYLEVNGRPPIGASMSDQVERLESQVKELFVPPQKEYNVQSSSLKQCLGSPNGHNYDNSTVPSSNNTQDVQISSTEPNNNDNPTQTQPKPNNSNHLITTTTTKTTTTTTTIKPRPR